MRLVKAADSPVICLISPPPGPKSKPFAREWSLDNYCISLSLSVITPADHTGQTPPPPASSHTPTLKLYLIKTIGPTAINNQTAGYTRSALPPSRCVGRNAGLDRPVGTARERVSTEHIVLTSNRQTSHCIRRDQAERADPAISYTTTHRQV